MPHLLTAMSIQPLNTMVKYMEMAFDPVMFLENTNLRALINDEQYENNRGRPFVYFARAITPRGFDA